MTDPTLLERVESALAEKTSVRFAGRNLLVECASALRRLASQLLEGHISTAAEIRALRAQAERDEKEIARLRDVLRLRYEECARCKGSLQPETYPPHCEDCSLDDEHLEAWEDAIEAIDAPAAKEAE